MTRNIFQETILPLLTDDPIEVIRYLQLKKLIKEELKCETCCENMNWTRYSRSKDGLGYMHKTVNHSVNFVDRKTGVHTQTIESYWNRHKSHIKTMRGCKRSFLNSYLYEFK